MTEKHAEDAWGEFFLVARLPVYELLEPSSTEGYVLSL